MNPQMNNTFIAAVIQQPISGNEKSVNLSETEQHIRDAVYQGAELIVLQELHATRYVCQIEDTDVFDLAEPLDGVTAQLIGALAEELDVVIVMSGFERRAAGLYHNTAQVFDGDQGRVGLYRKMHIPDDPGFYEKFYFTPGDAESSKLNGFEPVQTRLGKLGILICWDQWYPEAARLMALAGAECLIYPTAIGWDPNDDDDEQNRQRDAWLTIQRGHAIANGLPVLVANRTGYEPSPTDDSDGIEFWGSSFITGPQGEYLLEPSIEAEGALFAQIDLGRSEQVRRVWPFLRDRRVDAYQNMNRRWLDDDHS